MNVALNTEQFMEETVMNKANNDGIGKALTSSGPSETNNIALEPEVVLEACPQTAEMEEAFTDFAVKVHEALNIPAEKWPKGRTIKLEFGYVLTPRVRVSIGQE
jgi:hypothetical protein